MKYYAVQAFGFPGHPFPSRFVDSYRTKADAMRAARSMVREGWRVAEVSRELPRPAGHSIGAHWVSVETVGVA